MSRTLKFGIQISVIAFALAFSKPLAAQLLSEDFSTYSNGNLVGQNGWTQIGGAILNPIQVNNGQAVIPGFGTGGIDSQDASKSFASVPAPGSGTTTIYVGADVMVSSAGTNPAYFLAMTDIPSGFANERLTAKDNGGTYSFGMRVTGQAGYPFAFGAGLPYGVFQRVVLAIDMVALASNDDVRVFLNPTSLADPLYATATGNGTGSDPTALGIVILSQFSSATVAQAGVLINDVVISTNFADVVPEPATLTLLAAAGAMLFRRRR